MIPPTVGRVVWYHPSPYDGLICHGQPLAAQIAHVWSDSCVNIGGLDANGNHFSRTSVRLVQDGEAPPEGQSYVEWMPYQKQVAAGQIAPTLHAARSDVDQEPEAA